MPSIPILLNIHNNSTYNRKKIMSVILSIQSVKFKNSVGRTDNNLECNQNENEPSNIVVLQRVGVVPVLFPWVIESLVSRV